MIFFYQFHYFSRPGKRFYHFSGFLRFFMPHYNTNIFIAYSMHNLRLLDTYAPKSNPPCMFPSITLLLDHLSKICITLFWQSGWRCQKYVYIWKVTSSGRTEIQKFKIGKILQSQPFWNFSSATRGHFSNVNILLASLFTWSKKYHTDFWKMV